MNKKSLIVAIIVWILVLISGFIYFQMKKESKNINIIEVTENQNPLQNGEKKEKATFYILDSKSLTLKTQTEEIPYSFAIRDKLEIILQKTFENLWNEKILDTPQIAIHNIYIKNDTVYVDCDANILKIKDENRKNLLALYSIVNSITEIGNVKKVKILVDGKEETGIFSKTYTRNIKI